VPQSVLVYLGARGAAALTGIERTLSFLNTGLFGNLILVGLNRSRKKPAAPGEQTFSGTNTFSVRQPISPWQVVIGQRRVGGTITFIHLTTDKKYLHMVVTLACHVSEEIGDVHLDDEVVTAGMMDGSGVVTSGRFSRIDHVAHAERTDAASYTTAHPVTSVESVTGETQDSDGGQISYSLVDVSPAAPDFGQYKRVGDTFTFSTTNLGIHINYTEDVPLAVCRIKKSLGAEAGQPFPDLVAESEGKWTDAHRQTGHTKVYIRFDVSLLQGNAPNVSAVLKGLKLYDPRTGLTTWSANPALARAMYLMNTEFGPGAALSEIGSAELIAAANICDESVSLAAGGSELRYRANGAFLTSERPVDILQGLLSADAGMLTQVSDTWRTFAGAYEAATLTLTEKDFAGPIKIEPMQPRHNWANGAKGIFTDPGSSWQPTDFPAIVPTSTYLAEDGGETMYVDLDFSAWVTSSSQAQRLARIAVRQARSGMVVTALFKLTALRSFTGHSVAMTFAKYGWSAKESTIVESGFAVIQGQGGPALGVQLTMRETNSAIFSWSAEDQAQPTPPHSSLPNPFGKPGAVTGLAATSGTSDLLVAGDGSIISRARVTWSAVADGLTIGGHLELSYKRTSDPDFQSANLPGGLTEQYLDSLEDGAIYIIRIRGVSAVNIPGDWTTITHQVIGKTAKPANVGTLSYSDPILSWLPNLADPDLAGYVVRYQQSWASTDWDSATPAHQQGFITPTEFDTVKLVGGQVTMLIKCVDTTGNESAAVSSKQIDLRPPVPTGFTVTRQPDGTRELAWVLAAPPSDLDGYRIKYLLGSTSDWTAMTLLHTGVLKASPFESNQLAAGTYTFAIKSVDKAGNESATALFIDSLTIGDPRIAGSIEDFLEEPNWTETKTSCHLDGATGWLVANGSGTWATAATWAAMDAWVITPAGSIQYERKIDVGLITTFTPLVTVFADSAGGSVVIEEAHSNTDSGYSAFAAVGPEVLARWIKIRVTVTGTFPKLKSERIILSATPIAEEITDLSTSTLTGAYDLGVGNVRLPITKTYNVIKKVDVTLQSVGAGWSWELIDKDTSVGPQIKIYNSSNTLADALIDATVKGV